MQYTEMVEGSRLVYRAYWNCKVSGQEWERLRSCRFLNYAHDRITSSWVVFEIPGGFLVP
jgi:hypothetical protein